MSDQTFTTDRMLNSMLLAVQVSALTMLVASAAVAGQSATAELLGSGVGVSTPSWTQQAKLLAADGDVDHKFGHAVALSGDTALISNHIHMGTPSPVELNRVYEFTREGETWTEQATLEPDDAPLACVSDPDGFFKCPFYGWSVAIEGNLAVVGAPWDFRNSRDIVPPGRAYVFERINGQWTQQAVLTASDGIGFDQFGYSVDVSGDTILVGARYAAGDFALGDGAAYVFVRDGEDWVEQARLQPVDDDDWPHPWDCTSGFSHPCPEFGYAVALEGDTAVVGAYLLYVGESTDPTEREQAGAAYVFTREQGTWNQQTRLNPDLADCRDLDNYPEDTANCGFGSAVSVSGGSLLVSAGAARVGDVPLAGVGYIFVHEDGIWNEQAKLVPPEDDYNPGDILSFFGLDTNAVLDGDTVLMGSQTMKSNGPDGDLGTAYLYRREGAVWGQPQRLTTPLHDNQSRSRFGYSVALSGATALVGARGYSHDDVLRQGAAYIFTDSDATLAFAPASIDFGTVELGQSGDTQFATLSNLGDEILTGLTVPADLGNGFFAAESGGSCSSLPAGESCVIAFAFGPEAPGPASATLQVESSEGPTASLSLSGAGAAMPDQVFHHRFEDGGAQ